MRESTRVLVVSLFLISVSPAAAQLPEIVVGGRGSPPSTLRVYQRLGSAYVLVHDETLTDNFVRHVEIADMDNDGQNELLASVEVELWIYENVDGEMQRVHTVNESAFATAVGDVDNDGQNELVIVDDTGGANAVHIYENLTLAATLTFPELPKVAVIADPDGDGRNELIVGTSDGDAGGYIYVGEYSGGTFNQEWKSPHVASFRNSYHLSVGDSDDDGLREIAVGVSYYGRKLVVYEWDGATYSQKCVNNIGNDVRSVYYADTDGDAVEELIVGTACWSGHDVGIYDDCVLRVPLHETGGVVQATAADLDFDGMAEVVVGRGNQCGSGQTTPTPAVCIWEYIPGDDNYQVTWTDTFELGSSQNIFVAAGDLGTFEAVPAVSEWGLVATALLMLTAGTIVYMRRSSAEA